MRMAEKVQLKPGQGTRHLAVQRQVWNIQPERHREVDRSKTESTYCALRYMMDYREMPREQLFRPAPTSFNSALAD